MNENRVLLVQCCHLPQFFYLAEKLRTRHPNWHIEFLVTQHRHLQFYLNRFPCSHVHIAPSTDTEFCGYDKVLFPLLNRGYASIKRLAWGIGSKRQKINYRGDLEDMSMLELVISIIRVRCRPVAEFKNFIRQFPYPELGRRVLIVESCPATLTTETAGKLEAILPADTAVHRVAQGSLLRRWKDLRHQGIDGAVIYLSSETGYKALRFLPFLLRVKNLLIINEDGDFCSGEPRNIMGYFLRRFVFRTRFHARTARVLFLQTEGPDFTAECLKRLRTASLLPNARILLICSEEDRTRLEGLEGVVRTVSWKQKKRFSQAVGIRRQVRNFRPDLNCAAFTGRPVFRLQKLAYFLLGSRKKLAFNANHDAYWMGLGSLHRAFKKEPLPFSRDTEPTRVLLLETSSDANMLVALRTVQEAEVVPNAIVTIFCREDKKSFFEGCSEIEHCVTYSKGALLKNLRVLWKLFRTKPDVLAAVFAGTKIYPKHRFLFWFLPARNRLAFNQNLDCFYVDRKTFHLLFTESSGTPKSWLRYGLRVALFLPRFIYLLAWWSVRKLGLIRVR